MTVAAPAAVAAGAPAITVDPPEVVSVQGPEEQVTRDLTIGNSGGGDLMWSVYTESGEQLRRPIGSATPVNPVPPQTKNHGFLEFRNLPLPAVVVHPSQPAIPAGQVRLTHSNQQAIRIGASAACSTGLGLITAATGFLRHYTPSDFGVTGTFQVSSVSFGVESFVGLPNDVTVNLYTVIDPNGPFVYKNFKKIATAKTTLKLTDNLRIIQVPIKATVPAEATLVVEVATPDVLGAGLRLAATPGGQTATSFLRSKACGVPEPAETGALGIPHVQLLLNVTGTAAGFRACDVPAGTPWLGVAPTTGVVPPNGNQTVSLTFDSTGLAPGDVRTGELCLRSNDPSRPLVVVPVRLEVTVFPAIEVSPEALAAEQRPGEVTSQTLHVSNVGDAPLAWEITEAAAQCQAPGDVSWLAVDPTAGETGPGSSDEVTVSFDSTGLSAGDVTAVLCVSSNDPDRPVVEVPVTLTVVVTPAIEVSPEALVAEQRPGEVTSQTLHVSNVGDAPLAWEITEAAAQCQAPGDVSWLAVDPTAGETGPGSSDEVTVSFDSTGLSAGDVTAVLCVSSNDPDRPVVEVPVTLAVRGVACDQVITGVHAEPLTVTEGITCLEPGSRVEGQVNVLDGAGLISTNATIQGALATFGATIVEVTGTTIIGPVSVRGTTGSVVLTGNQVVGSVLVVDNRTDAPPLISGNMIVGSLLCSFNDPVPGDGGESNNVVGGLKLDQCAGL